MEKKSTITIAYTLTDPLNVFRQHRGCLKYSNWGDYQILFIGEEKKTQLIDTPYGAVGKNRKAYFLLKSKQ